MRRRRTSVMIAFAASLCIGLLAPTVPAVASGVGRYIVVLRRDQDPRAAARHHQARYGVKSERFYRSIFRGYAATLPEARVSDLRRDPSVLMVSKSRRFRAAGEPRAAARFQAAAQSTPTGIGRTGADAILGTGEGVQIAVLDTGIDRDHPDLAANILGGADCSGPDTGDFDDQNGHGTHVAGIIAALDNDLGVVGVAPQAELWAVRILDPAGEGTDEEILCGLEFVYERAPAFGGLVRIANMSLEASIPQADDGDCGLTNQDAIHFAICLVVDAGVTVVTAAGNFTEDIEDVAPAAYDEVIAATALSDWDGAPCGAGTDPTGEFPDDTFASFSSFAVSPADQAHTIGAPGVAIQSTFQGGGYESFDGTSMSAAHVTGVAARYIETHPGTPSGKVLQVLQSAAEPVDVNFNGECTDPAVSHTDPSGKHPEPVVRPQDWRLDVQASTPGVVRGNRWLLTNGFDANLDIGFAYGSANDKVVVGDWDGDGIDTPGVVKGNVWYLSNDFDAGHDIPPFGYGSASDRVVVGDWDRDGIDEPAVIKGNVWYLNTGFDGRHEKRFAYGSANDRIAVGKWIEGGFDLPAVIKSNNVWYLNYNYDSVHDQAFSFGRAGAATFAGDWDGDGIDTPGIRDGRIWHLNLGFDRSAEIWFPFGNASDRPIVGDWDGANP